MSVIQMPTPSMQKLDPLKRVNYTFGLVLGVDEFQQEQTYLMEKNHSQYRLVHGYGTVCGLQVRVIDGVQPEVRVSRGVAIDPQGQEMHVQQEMCARLNEWLKSHKDTLQSVFGAPPLSLSLCVVLCYRECPTDMVPVPGEPCRTQQDAMAASHISESFQVRLCLNTSQLVTSPPLGSPPIDLSALPDDLCFRPVQQEEDAIREFGQLLHRIQITASAPGFVTQQELEDLVRQLGTPSGPAIVSPPIGSPPLAGEMLYLHPDDACDVLRAAFLVWVTEVRPTLAAATAPVGCEAPAEQCVLLAELTLAVDATWKVTGPAVIDETHRPYLVQSRLLQECLSCGLIAAAVGPTGQGSFTVAAGAFHIVGKQAVATGPTYNGLTASHALNNPDGVYLLKWSGIPGYVSPLSSPPNAHSYVILGTPMAKLNSAVRVSFEVLEFLGDGILVRIVDTQGQATAAGFMVEIKEIKAAGS